MGVACQILVKKPGEGFYRAGRPVAGVVKYALDAPAEYKDITLALQGESHCSWSETDSDENSTTYRGEETHVSQVVRLLGGAGIRTLPVGAYEHKFIFNLPKKIPPTFNTRTGDVTYKIVLQFKKNRILNNTKTFTADIKVRSFLDIAVPIAPIVFGLDKVLFKLLSAEDQKISLTAVIAAPYVKPGEKTTLKFAVTNNTGVNIKGIRAELIRESVYTADCKRQYSREKQLKESMAETVGVPARSQANLAVCLPTSDLEWSVQHSRVINNKYKVLVTLRLPIPHRNATTMVPLLLGEREEDIPIEVGVDIVNAMEREFLPPQYNEVIPSPNE